MKSFSFLKLLVAFVALCSTNLLCAQKENYILQFLPDSNFYDLKISYNKSPKDSIEVYKEISKIKDIFLARGYLACSVDSISIQNKKYIVYFYSGANFSNATIYPDQSFTDEVSRIFKIKDKFSLTDFLLIKEKIINYFENNGYPFVNIYFQDIRVDRNVFFATASLDKSYRVQINKINIISDKEIDSTIIYKCIDIYPGDIYSQRKIEEISAKIENIPYYSQTRKPEVVFLSDLSVSVTLFLKKEKANRFSGILGFGNSENKDKLQLQGTIDVLLQNILGRGETLQFNWKRISEFKQNLEIEAEYPYLFRTRYGIRGSYQQKRLDTSSVLSSYSIGAQYLINSSNKISLSYQHRMSQISAPDSVKSVDFGDKNIGFTLKLGTLILKTQKLDFINNPRKGYAFDLHFSGGVKEYDEDAQKEEPDYIRNNQYGEYYFKTNIYLPIFKSQTIVFGIVGSGVLSDVYYENELLLFGGATSLRGFSEDYFLSSFYSIINVEYRFLFSKNSNIFIFYDQAYYRRTIPQKYYEDFPDAFGLGLQLGIKSGLFRISYALGRQEGLPFSVKTSQVHLSYINKF